MALPVLLKLDLWDHPKTIRLSVRMKIPVVHVVGHLAALWRFCARFAPTGDLSSYSDQEIADVAMCTDPEFAVHLRECGWLDGSRVHDLTEHQGKKAVANARSADRMKKKREANNVRSTGERAANTSVTRGEHDANPSSFAVAVPSPKLPLSPPGTPFSLFWEAWPPHKRKKARPQCEKKWCALSEEVRQKAMKSLAVHKLSEGWRKEGGEYIPGPLPWLNQEGWTATPAPQVVVERHPAERVSQLWVAPQ